MKALSIKGLKKVYASGTTALRGIDLDIESGDFFGLLGQNGAGKTTTIGIITGLVKKSSGEIEVFEKDLEKNNEEIKMKIGMVPQEINLYFWDRVSEVVMNQAGYYGINKKEAKARTEECLKQLGLWEKRNKLTRELSGGMKRRLMIARALVHKPKLLILDEPTAGVDVEIRLETWEFLKKINKEGTTIILTTHYLEEAEQLCNKIAIIHKGKIMENSTTKSLLRKMSKQIFVLDLDKTPDIKKYEDYNLELKDEHSFEATITKENTLEKLFKILETEKITILGMRNKSNRLEQLFMEIVNSDKK